MYVLRLCNCYDLLSSPEYWLLNKYWSKHRNINAFLSSFSLNFSLLFFSPPNIYHTSQWYASTSIYLETYIVECIKLLIFNWMGGISCQSSLPVKVLPTWWWLVSTLPMRWRKETDVNQTIRDGVTFPSLCLNCLTDCTLYRSLVPNQINFINPVSYTHLTLPTKRIV